MLMSDRWADAVVDDEVAAFGVVFVPSCHRTTIVRSIAMKATDITAGKLKLELLLLLLERSLLRPMGLGRGLLKSSLMIVLADRFRWSFTRGKYESINQSGLGSNVLFFVIYGYSRKLKIVFDV